MKYRREIDGLRALAVIPVILFHAGFKSFSGGFIGVDIFFVISGYLISTIILAEKKAGKFSLSGFYERRARRILPALFFVLAASIPFALLWLLPREMNDFSQSLIGVLLLASNIVFWRQSGYFDIDVEFKPLIHTWSLAIEEQYYLFFPFLLMLGWRFGKKKLWFALAAIACCSLLAAQVFSKTAPDATFFLLHTRAWELIIGALAAFYLAQENRRQINEQIGQALSILGISLIIISISLLDKHTPFPSFYALAPTIGAALIILFAGPTNIIGKILGYRLFVGIGLVSYSAYLWHQPLFAFARTKYSLKAGSASFLIISLATLIFAYLTWRFIEKPFRDKSVVSRTKIVYSSLIFASILLSIGLVGNRTGGSFFRYDPKAMEVLGKAEESGKYVWGNANRLYLSEFGKSGRKVLVVGDSMAADFVNLIHETNIIDKISLSFYTIGYPCGNLYLKENFIDKIEAEHRQACINNNWYENSKLKRLLKEADQVWLISVWVPWQIELLDRSLKNLKNDFGDKFFIISRKSFGAVDLKNLSKLTLPQRLDYRSTPVPYVLEINQKLAAAVHGHHYYNISSIACEKNVCRNFNDRGELMSYDGSHLTQAGAKYLGQKLAQDSHFINEILNETAPYAKAPLQGK